MATVITQVSNERVCGHRFRRLLRVEYPSSNIAAALGAVIRTRRQSLDFLHLFQFLISPDTMV